MDNAIGIFNTDKTSEEEGVFVIAEIGKNFIQTEKSQTTEEYLQNSKDLVDRAVLAGASAVKFQTHIIDDEVLNVDFTSPHFKGSDRYSWVMRNQKATPLEEFWKPLKSYCDKKGIIFFSTPMSRKAAVLLNDLGIPLWKVGSGDVQDYVLLDYLIETKKPIIISSGMVSLSELDEVIKYITNKKASLAVLYCVSEYPCPPEHFNLGTIEYLKEKYPDVVIGFSDHSVDGHEVDLAAVKLGAQIIEKHFSTSRKHWGSDHKASVLPDEMKEMVDGIHSKKYRDIDTSLYYGDREKELEGANNQFRPYFNKSLVAGVDIPIGTVLTMDMVYAMRPQMYIKGLSSNKLNRIIGKRSKRAIKKYESITNNYFEL